MKSTITKYLYLISFAILLNSCTVTKDNFFAPLKRIVRKVDDWDASESFKQGYRDGCETGFSTFVTDYYKMFYGFKKDVSKIQARDIEYTRAWSAAMLYCRHYALGSLQSANMPPVLPGQKGTHSLSPVNIKQSIFGSVYSPNNYNPLLGN